MGCVVSAHTKICSYRKWTSQLKPGQCVQDIHPKQFGFNLVKLHGDYPAKTITKTHTPAVGLLHHAEDRFMSISELKRLSSFPDSFRFIDDPTKSERHNISTQWSRIGNSVPPLLMKAIAENIRKAPFMRDNQKPTVISTFAGCGGSSLGYHMAGFKELLAVEWDANAVATFKLNFPDVPVYHGDIAKLTGEECMRLAGIKSGELDVFDGSPPCQGFSTAGNRKYDDPRNSLFKEYARLLSELQPKVFVMENVTGMVKGHMKQAYLTIIKTLRDCGYKAKGEVLNAMHYGVPQSRERVIIIGVRNDIDIEPSHPKPKTKPIPLRDVLPSLGGSNSQQNLHWYTPASKPACTLVKTASVYLVMPAFNDKYAKLYNRVPVGGNAKHVIGTGACSCQKPDKNRPSPTLPKMNTGRGFATICHPEQPRALTIDEAKIIQSFPEQFQFIGTYQQQWARIGNSVPPLLMLSIASHIRSDILNQSSGCQSV